MCEEEYVLIKVDDKFKWVFVESRTFALGSPEALNAHANFKNLKKKFSEGENLYGYTMIEVKRKNNDNQSNSKYDIVGIVKFTIPEKLDINILPNRGKI